MSERTTGIYRIVTLPWLYKAIQNALADPRARSRVQQALFKDVGGKDVLEIGCGPGTWVPFLENAASYTGIDWNPDHIEAAQNQYGSSSRRFICGDLNDPDALDPDRRFDVTISMGVLHHLDDRVAEGLLERLSEKLRDGGQLIGAEPVFHASQNPIAVLLKKLDSGQHIRREAEYSDLLARSFSHVETQVVTDFMRVPYSHCLLFGDNRG